MGQLNTHDPIYYKKDKQENCPHLRLTLDSMYTIDDDGMA